MFGNLHAPPDHPEVKVNTANLSIEEAAHRVLNGLEKQGLFDPKRKEK